MQYRYAIKICNTDMKYRYARKIPEGSVRVPRRTASCEGQHDRRNQHLPTNKRKNSKKQQQKQKHKKQKQQQKQEPTSTHKEEQEQQAVCSSVQQYAAVSTHQKHLLLLGLYAGIIKILILYTPPYKLAPIMRIPMPNPFRGLG